MAPLDRAHAFHVADLVAGHLRGNPCPCCGERGARRLFAKHLGLGSVYRCGRCALLFRPTGLQTGAVARWYYSVVYGDQGIATEPTTTDREVARARARAAGKDRARLVASLLERVPIGEREVGVLGASWGYELLCLDPLGVPTWGIELGDARREHGRKAFGLELHASIGAARAAGRRGGVLMSSHVLEHVPRLDALLDEVDRELAPAVQVHVTPRVDPPTAAVASVIGREHPLGITEAFWTRRAARTGARLELAARASTPGGPSDETIAVLVRLGIAWAGAALDFG